MELRKAASFICAPTIKRLLIISLFIFFTICYYQSNLEFVIPSTTTVNRNVQNQAKSVLIWNAYKRFELEFLGDGHKPFSQCPIKDCFITQNRSLAPLHEFDAVLFNMPPLSIYKFPVNEPRRPDQRYIFFSQEPPTYIGEEVDKFNHLFNWTMSYQKNSDIRYHYGNIIPEGAAPTDGASLRAAIHHTRQGENFAAGKTKLVAWFVSHCYTSSRREKYVSILRQYVPVDIYGGCYTMKCEMNHTAFLSTNECYGLLDSTYKFYLAFENSFCNDYVTEKFYDILSRRIIPVVLGGANYSAIAPPHSYIDAVNYSPRELAAYLQLLAKDDRLYNEYFWWKPYFKIESRYPEIANRALCTLCEKLHSDKSVSIYHDLKANWSQSTQCHGPKYKGVRMFFGIFK